MHQYMHPLVAKVRSQNDRDSLAEIAKDIRPDRSRLKTTAGFRQSRCHHPNKESAISAIF